MTPATWLLTLALAAAPTETPRVVVQPMQPRPGTTPGAPFALIIQADEPPVLSQRPVPPLSGRQLARLRTAQGLREADETARAADTLRALLAEVPHHALVLTELARTQAARNQWQEIERLGTAERAATHDSLLLGHDLAMALERLKRPRDAARVAMECWIVRPGEADWAYATLTRLAGSDPKGVREAVRRTVSLYPDRVDLQSAAARLEWKLGDEAGAMRALLASDRPGLTPPLRWRFADELLGTGAERDSVGAAEALTSMAADVRFDPSLRMMAATRALEVHQARGTMRAGAPELYKALETIPPERWNPDLLLSIARGLREAGQGAQARRLLEAPGLQGAARQGAILERALNDLRDGPPEAAIQGLRQIERDSPEAAFRYAEALFFSGQADSALVVYQRVSQQAEGPFTGAALERMFLIEDADPKSGLPAIGHLMYLDWRGDSKQALALADSLYHHLPQGPLWAQIAVFWADRLDAAGDSKQALAALLEVVERRPSDRMAPVACQRAGDIYRLRLDSEPEALAQYETCLDRYPKAWNSAEVRRRLEALRKRRF